MGFDTLILDPDTPLRIAPPGDLESSPGKETITPIRLAQCRVVESCLLLICLFRLSFPRRLSEWRACFTSAWTAAALLLHIIAAVRRLPEHERGENFPMKVYSRWNTHISDTTLISVARPPSSLPVNLLPCHNHEVHDHLKPTGCVLACLSDPRGCTSRSNIHGMGGIKLMYTTNSNAYSGSEVRPAPGSLTD